MGNTDQTRFASFAQNFVRSYWLTVSNGDFPMPPNEPVEETLDELLSEVSHTTEVSTSSGRSKVSYKLLMTSKHGDWWLFKFSDNAPGWRLVGCEAKSEDKTKPHDLLGPFYSQHFEPFLRHVTDTANVLHRI